ncbi:hypothetical protein FOA52_008443 [Chlamydomonas sp. UWO 241]|nr:hypothetical protein FOA52_008443 [Chlamydomonas sp. UWO 241]
MGASRSYRTSRAGALLLLLATASALLLLCSSPARADITESRYKYWRPCSLAKELEDICQIKSRIGINQTEGSYKGLMMYFGESSCFVEIEQCKPGTCYSWRDLTQQLPTDPTVAMTTGFMKAVKVLSGATDISFSRQGFAFKANSTKVVIRYTTQTCAEFYTSHSGVGQQLCNQPIEALSEITTSTPNSLACVATVTQL